MRLHADSGSPGPQYRPEPEPRGFRLPPHNLAAEMASLGAMLHNPEVIDDVFAEVREADYYRDSHRVIFGVIRELHDAGKPVDLVTLDERLRAMGQFDKVGGRDYLTELSGAFGSSSDGPYYAQIVRQKAVVREVLEAGSQMERDAYSDTFSADQIVEAAEKRIFGIGQSLISEKTGSVVAAVRAARLAINRRAAGEVSGLFTGFEVLDGLINGFQDGNLIIVAARPGHGKSVFGHNFCDHSAINLRVKPFLFSLEMKEAEVGIRLLSARARVDGNRIKRAWELTDEEWARLDQAEAELAANPWPINDSTSLTVSQIASISRRAVARDGVGAIVIDYLQLLEGDGLPGQPRHEQLETISRRLKNLAGELGVPIIALAQLNRMSEGREDKRPRLSELRNSGALEQDADVAILLNRPELHDAADSPGISEMIVAKNRSGPTGTVLMGFVKSQTRLDNLPPAPIDF